MTKMCTDLEQSKKLVELGLGFNTADMSYPRELYLGESEYPVVIADGFKVDWTKALPCWSLAALLEVMPQEASILKDITRTKYRADCPLYSSNNWHDNAVDAVFEMVCWLLENNLIQT